MSDNPKNFFSISVGGQVTPSGRREHLARESVEKLDSDAAATKDLSELTGAQQGEIFSVRKDEADGRVLAGDVLRDGTVTSQTTGPLRSKKERELSACRLLVAHLNRLGADWSSPVHVGGDRDDGFDCVATVGDQTLRMDVTQITRDQAVWERLALTQGTDSSRPIDQAVQEIYAAIEAKICRSQRGIVLVLDATDLAGHGLPRVLRALKAGYAEWLGTLEFEAIWVVGPSDHLIFQLTGSKAAA
jgi:hypothetical protein